MPVIPVSTITRDNIDQLLYAIADKLEEYKDVDFTVEEEEAVGINRVLYINIHRHKINLQFQEMMMVLMW